MISIFCACALLLFLPSSHATTNLFNGGPFTGPGTYYWFPRDDPSQTGESGLCKTKASENFVPAGTDWMPPVFPSWASTFKSIALNAVQLAGSNQCGLCVHVTPQPPSVVAPFDALVVSGCPGCGSTGTYVTHFT
jgi:hypothetical protein